MYIIILESWDKMEKSELKRELTKINDEVKRFMEVTLTLIRKKEEIKERDTKINESTFWQDQKKAEQFIKETSEIKKHC